MSVPHDDSNTLFFIRNMDEHFPNSQKTTYNWNIES